MVLKKPFELADCSINGTKFLEAKEGIFRSDNVVCFVSPLMHLG